MFLTHFCPTVLRSYDSNCPILPKCIRIYNSGLLFYYCPITWCRTNINTVNFYSASALLAMQSAVLARAILSVRPSVRPSVRLSVTFRYCVQTNEDTIVQFSASGRTIPLVSGEVKFIRIFAGDHPQWGR